MFDLMFDFEYVVYRGPYRFTVQCSGNGNTVYMIAVYYYGAFIGGKAGVKVDQKDTPAIDTLAYAIIDKAME